MPVFLHTHLTLPNNLEKRGREKRSSSQGRNQGYCWPGTENTQDAPRPWEKFFLSQTPPPPTPTRTPVTLHLPFLSCTRVSAPPFLASTPTHHLFILPLPLSSCIPLEPLSPPLSIPTTPQTHIPSVLSAHWAPPTDRKSVV